MPSSISPLFMFKSIIKTQKYYKKIKILVTKEGKFHFIKWGVFCHLFIKIKILWSVNILEIDYVRLAYFKFNPLTKVKKSIYMGGKMQAIKIYSMRVAMLCRLYDLKLINDKEYTKSWTG